MMVLAMDILRYGCAFFKNLRCNNLNCVCFKPHVHNCQFFDYAEVELNQWGVEDSVIVSVCCLCCQFGYSKTKVG